MAHSVFLTAASLATLLGMLTAPASAAHSCSMFIDNRGRAMVYHVRQIIPIEVDAYASTSLPEMDARVDFQWSVTPKTADVVPDPLSIRGRAFFYPGRREATYTIKVDGSYATDPANHGAGTVKCSAATLTIDVQNDYAKYLEAGITGASGSGIHGRFVDEFTELSLPMLLSLTALRAPSEPPNSDVTALFGVKLADQRLYSEIGYMHHSGRNHSAGGAEVALERLVDVDRSTSFGWTLGYCLCTHRIFVYGVSGTLLIPGDRYFIEAGIRNANGRPAYAESVRYIVIGQRL